jgi:hypothetical protein
MCQVTTRKTNASEPLMMYRKFGQTTSKSEVTFGSREEPRGRLAYCLGGVRYIGGVSLVEALMWNVGTCSPMPRENSK